MGRLIDSSSINNFVMMFKSDWGIFATDIGNAIDSIVMECPTVEAIPKDQYEARLKADLVAMLTDIQLDIKELWDNRYDVWLDNQYYIGKNDTLEEVDDIIQQKINSLKEQEDGKDN